MTYRGHVENGVIRLQGSVILPEGAEVRVELVQGKEEFRPECAADRRDVVRIVADVPQQEWDRLPADLTDNLDHYIYGTPR